MRIAPCFSCSLIVAKASSKPSEEAMFHSTPVLFLPVQSMFPSSRCARCREFCRERGAKGALMILDCGSTPVFSIQQLAGVRRMAG